MPNVSTRSGLKDGLKDKSCWFCGDFWVIGHYVLLEGWLFGLLVRKSWY